MNTTDRISEEELSAWVDGELRGADLERVEAWLAAHPDDAARAHGWLEDRLALQGLHAETLHEPVPAALRAAVWRRPAWPRWAVAAACAGLLVAGAALGGGAVWQMQRQQMAQLAAGTADGWVRRAALAHAVYVPEPRHAVEVGAQEEHLARWLTRRIEVPVKLFDLRSQGFELVGGRLLPDGPGKSAQLMYQDARGGRVTVYLRKPEPKADTAFRYEQQGALGLFYWVEEGCGYALVGALPRARLLALAEAIYHQHPQPAGEGTVAPPPPAAPAASAAARATTS